MIVKKFFDIETAIGTSNMFFEPRHHAFIVEDMFARQPSDNFPLK